MLNQITTFGIISFVNFLSTIILGSFAFLKGRKSDVKLAYAFFAYTLAFYAFFYFLWQSSNDRMWAIVLFKWTIVGVVLINTAFFNFTYTLLGMHRGYKWHLYLVHGTNLFFCYSALALFYHDWKVKFTYGLWPVPSVIFHIYLVWWFAQVICCFYLIWKKGIIEAVGKQKRQCKWVLTACFIGYVGGATNWFVWYGVNFPPYMNAGVALYALILGYAVLRHRLMDIEVIIKKTVVFAGIVAAAVAAIALPFALLQTMIGESLGIPNPYILMAFGIATTVLIYRPVERWLIDLTDRYLFQKKYNYHKLLKENVKQIAFIHTLDEVAKQVSVFLIKQGRIKNAGMFIRKESGLFELRYPLGYGGRMRRPELSLPDKHGVVEKLSKADGPVVLEDLERKMKADGGVAEVVDLMKRLKAEVLIPSFISERLNGKRKGRTLRSILVLGGKKSDEPYTDEDLDVFYTLAQESAIAIENARLYDENIRRESNKILGDMTGSVAHEMRHPISYIQYTTHFMNRVFRDLDNLSHALGSPENGRGRVVKIREELSKHLKTIESSTDRINGIVQTLEDFAKMKWPGGKIGDLTQVDKASFRQIDFKILMDLVKEQLKFRYRGQTQFLDTLEIETSNPPPILFGNQSKLIQVFINLIANAHDAIENSAVKKITVKAYPDPQERRYVCIEVQDTGCGIPDELKDKVLEHEVTTKAEKGGSGYGLSWCKNLIETVHEGRISFESTAGVGTTFYLRIPAWDESSLAGERAYE